MAVSRFSINDLILISKFNHKQLHTFMNGRSVRGAMTLRRELQIALAAYSKTHQAIGRFDAVQGSILLICKQIEMWARHAYFKAMLPKLVASRPALASPAALKLARPGETTGYAGGDPRTAAKIALKEKWEKFLRDNSF